ncbi:DnaD domain protein [Clostridium sporogenes]|uniref:DnaD domain protein n=1 Tax=Clostridium sporogenes TaxID=1509 RepID=A0A1J1D1F2_CLOSG|nr:DnaD domain protein [Clostridium sporogenes]APF28655.1 DnaD domain protein [Clostridium sporogenes]APH15001.1 DnaD domain protein [Clostridium sporogenes]
MAGEGKGWISLYRSIQDHWLWQEKPFSKGQAWLDLLLSANHKENKFLLGNELLQVERGSFITSELKLMEKWGWSKSKVRNFLDLLKDDNMIIKVSDKKKTTITIVNYELYQELRTTEELQKDHARTTKEPCKDTNNNDNNVNNDNKYINNKEEVNPMEVYQNNIYPMPGVIEIEGINSWSNNLGNELVIYAINIAAKSNVRKWNFIEKILIDWDKNGIKTLVQAKAYSENRKKKGGQKQNGYSSPNTDEQQRLTAEGIGI